MSTYTMEELESERAELLPSRETLSCYATGRTTASQPRSTSINQRARQPFGTATTTSRPARASQAATTTSTSGLRRVRLTRPTLTDGPAVRVTAGTRQRPREGRPAAPGRPSSLASSSCEPVASLAHPREVQIRERCHATREHPSRGARPPPRRGTRLAGPPPGWPRGSSCSASSGTPATASRRRWCDGPMARSSRCPRCCTRWPAGSTAPATRPPSRRWSAPTSAGH